jgi:hypothetical protein
MIRNCVSLVPAIVALAVGMLPNQIQAEPVTVARGWQVVANEMADERWAPAATVLGDGKTALVAGGYSFSRHRCVASADLFDSAKLRFDHVPSRLNVPRDFASCALEPNGDVLIAGGYNDVLGSLWVAELYHPETGQFTVCKGQMTEPRELFCATPLDNGNVLLTGGLDLYARRTTSSAEIYNPATDTFVRTKGRMRRDRFGHAACRLRDGRVLVVGGSSLVIGKASGALKSAEIYDPNTGMFQLVPTDMQAERDRPTASLLPDGRVLVAGGQGLMGKSVSFSEIFDPKTDSFSQATVPQINDRMAHAATGQDPVLLTGLKHTTASSELFDPSTLSFVAGPDLPFAVHDQAQLQFGTGLILVAGGKVAPLTGPPSSEARGATWTASIPFDR